MNSAVRVAKGPFTNFPVLEYLDFGKIPIRLFELLLYLAGVAAAETTPVTYERGIQ